MNQRVYRIEYSRLGPTPMKHVTWLGNRDDMIEHVEWLRSVRHKGDVRGETPVYKVHRVTEWELLDQVKV